MQLDGSDTIGLVFDDLLIEGTPGSSPASDYIDSEYNDKEDPDSEEVLFTIRVHCVKMI
jgi:hypothetical protein